LKELENYNSRSNSSMKNSKNLGIIKIRPNKHSIAEKFSCDHFTLKKERDMHLFLTRNDPTENWRNV